MTYTDTAAVEESDVIKNPKSKDIDMIREFAKRNRVATELLEQAFQELDRATDGRNQRPKARQCSMDYEE